MKNITSIDEVLKILTLCSLCILCLFGAEKEILQAVLQDVQLRQLMHYYKRHFVPIAQSLGQNTKQF